MSIFHRLNPPIEVDTPDRGRAWAFWMIDYTMHGNMVYGCVIKKTGEIWWYENPKIVHAPCETFGIRLDEIKECEAVPEMRHTDDYNDPVLRGLAADDNMFNRKGNGALTWSWVENGYNKSFVGHHPPFGVMADWLLWDGRMTHKFAVASKTP